MLPTGRYVNSKLQGLSAVTKKPRFIARLAAVALASAACFPSSVFAQANVDVNITISNGITILYYYSTLDITLNAGTLAGLLTTGCAAGSIADTYYCNRGNPGGVTATAAATRTSRSGGSRNLGTCSTLAC